ncbi:MAG: hypothetical protein FRX48_07211 [Lasallia pustulata]|uniref:RING-14 protein n=1 Tax=Lasallia pustulata TaxID=136370 RepID=A0A5M8PHJ1_9LECA|nr:MAG: hypothetical protein FRX48_07211 [Lasallia pustulata]
MKFAHAFEEALKEEDYPAHWVQSAISYRQLKKCIKNVRQELSSIGLSPDTLRQLWQSAEAPVAQASASIQPFQYTFAGDVTTFQPKLVFVVDERDGNPIDASLSPETRAYLLNLANKQEEIKSTRSRNSVGERIYSNRSGNTNSENNVTGGHMGTLGREVLIDYPEASRRVEVPLRSDSEFFRLLNLELSELNALQLREQAQLVVEISCLGKDISKLARPSQGLKRTDLYAWRDIFSAYTDAKIFFSTTERDIFHRNSATAHKQLQVFSSRIHELGVLKTLKKESRIALDRFLRINLTLLRNLKFLELNGTAMTKILKKFDKQTALGAGQTFADLIAADSFASRLAKAVCFKVSEELLPIVPQLNDYLCPVCFNIAFKPIRLRCGHVFCIRCMITMQRAKADHCPLCRCAVVMEADSTNLDPALLDFLKRYFPGEVRTKQKENERDAAIDKYGKEYDKCHVM